MKVLQRNSDSFKTEISNKCCLQLVKMPCHDPTKKMMTDLFKAYDLEVSVLNREI